MGFTLQSFPADTLIIMFQGLAAQFNNPDLFELVSSMNALGKMGFTYATLPDEIRVEIVNGLDGHLQQLKQTSMISSSIDKILDIFSGLKFLEANWIDVCKEKETLEASLLFAIEALVPYLQQNQVLRLLDR